MNFNIIINDQPMNYAINYGECAGFNYLISKNDEISIFGTQALNAYAIVKCYKVIPGNNITQIEDAALKDLSNVTAPTQAFKTMAIGWGIPDYSTIITGLRIPFTAPTDGLISWNNNGTSHCTINGNTFYIGGNDEHNEGNVTLFLSKNDVISFTFDSGTPCFVSLKGAN